MLPSGFCPRNLQLMCEAADNLCTFIKATEDWYRQLLASKHPTKSARLAYMRSGFRQLRIDFSGFDNTHSKYAKNRKNTTIILARLHTPALDARIYDDSLGDLLAYARCLQKALDEDIADLRTRGMEETAITHKRAMKLFQFTTPIDKRGCTDKEWIHYTAEIHAARDNLKNLLQRFENEDGAVSFQKFQELQPEIEAQAVSFRTVDIEFNKFTADHAAITKRLNATEKAELELTRLNYWREFNSVGDPMGRNLLTNKRKRE